MSRRQPRITIALLLIPCAIGLASCAPQANRPTAERARGGEVGPNASRAASTRPLNIGLFQEPAVMGGKFGGGGSGVADYNFLFAAKLVHYDHLGNPVPVLVEE